jgi:putative membrane protein
MKSNITCLTVGLLLSTFSLSAIATTHTTSQNSTTSSQSSLTATQTQNGQILEVLMVIDNNEINAANAVLTKTTNPNVKTFANTMITDHSENLKAIQNLAKQINITPVVSSKSTKLQQAGQDELKKLSSLSSNQLDTTYINAMVKGHEAALKLIDNKLLPNASDPKVKSFLTDTRAVVAHHLQLAQTVQSQLPK